eukprot:2424241-Amphidinium_carterae.1
MRPHDSHIRSSRLWQKEVDIDGTKITLVEDPTLPSSGDETWCAWCAWPAAFALAHYLATWPEGQLAERCILELGAGI